MAHAAPSSSGSDAVPPVDPPPPGAATRERKTAAATTDLAAGDASDGNMAPREVTPPGEAADAEPQAESRATTEAGDTAPPAVAGGTEASPAVDESDLHALPGAGIGLVWMLQRCGVSSLADLADADPERLRRDMGLVGELLDLSTWIAFARDAVEDKPPTRP
jgi:predicted flap endonuclease-1-like 5' DNA nuclease